MHGLVDVGLVSVLQGLELLGRAQEQQKVGTTSAKGLRDVLGELQDDELLKERLVEEGRKLRGGRGDCGGGREGCVRSRGEDGPGMMLGAHACRHRSHGHTPHVA